MFFGGGDTRDDIFEWVLFYSNGFDFGRAIQGTRSVRIVEVWGVSRRDGLDWSLILVDLCK